MGGPCSACYRFPGQISSFGWHPHPPADVGGSYQQLIAVSFSWDLSLNYKSHFARNALEVTLFLLEYSPLPMSDMG